MESACHWAKGINLNTDRIKEILDQSVIPYRKGDEVDGLGERVKNLYEIDHIDKLSENETKVDCFSVFIGVNGGKCNEYKDELFTLISDFPDKKLFKAGFSYKELAKEIGQNNALRLFGFGVKAGWWEIVGPYELMPSINKRSATEQFMQGCLYINWADDYVAR